MTREICRDLGEESITSAASDIGGARGSESATRCPDERANRHGGDCGDPARVPLGSDKRIDVAEKLHCLSFLFYLPRMGRTYVTIAPIPPTVKPVTSAVNKS
jgi:hypothetical protein